MTVRMPAFNRKNWNETVLFGISRAVSDLVQVGGYKEDCLPCNEKGTTPCYEAITLKFGQIANNFGLFAKPPLLGFNEIMAELREKL